MLANGMGGIDWAGLPMVAALLGVEDVESFARQLMVIKHFRRDRPDRPEEDDDGTSHTLS
jgi:hypothetical protein